MREIDEKKVVRKNENLEEILKRLRETFNRKEKNIYEKLEQLRVSFLNCKPEKTGWNPFSKFYYFALEDIVPVAEPLCQAIGLCAFPDIEIEDGNKFAVMYLVDMDNTSIQLRFRIPMAEIDNSGMKSMQDIGAVKTYARRYLWLDILNSAEFDDEIDATSGSDNSRKSQDDTAVSTRPPKVAKRDERPAGVSAVKKEKSLGQKTWNEITAFFGYSEDLSDKEKSEVRAEAKAFLKDTFGISKLEEITEEIANDIEDYIKRSA